MTTLMVGNGPRVDVLRSKLLRLPLTVAFDVLELIVAAIVRDAGDGIGFTTVTAVDVLLMPTPTSVALLFIPIPVRVGED